MKIRCRRRRSAISDLLRQHSTIPIAMGELFNNPNEFLPLVKDRLIDFIRLHLSQVGGLSPAKKIAALCEFFGVRTAWHGPGDTSPVGHAANLALDLCCQNFGIQEFTPFNQATLDSLSRLPGNACDGSLWPNDQPGLGNRHQRRTCGQVSFPRSPLQWSVARHPPSRWEYCSALAAGLL